MQNQNKQTRKINLNFEFSFPEKATGFEAILMIIEISFIITASDYCGYTTIHPNFPTKQQLLRRYIRGI